jgi:hypothetical protein
VPPHCLASPFTATCPIGTHRDHYTGLCVLNT